MAIRLKVCGMREPANISDLATIAPDFMGFIFYAKSPRYVGEEAPDFSGMDASVKKVGVFVNETEEEILRRATQFGLDMIQLHGKESVSLAAALKAKGLEVIKVFSVMDELPVAEMKPFEAVVDYFLFDTKTPAHGGSGQKFDWRILEAYDFEKPFFLSGGIDLDDMETIRQLEIPQLFALDINSRFEVSPALKDIKKIKALKQII